MKPPSSPRVAFPTPHYSQKQEPPLSTMLHSFRTTSCTIKPLPLTTFTIFLHKFSTNNTMQFSKTIRAETTVHQVPGFSYEEIDRIAEQTFRRYTTESLPKRKGKGVAIVWFRNDLRVLDNEALFKAWVSSEAVLPVYCVDPRLFSTTRYFGFPKTGGLRAQFLIECLADLRKNLMKCGLDLLIQHGKPEEILPSLAKAYGVHTVYAQKETCSEELNVERLVSKSLQKVVLSSSLGQSAKPNSKNSTNLELIWGSSMYHIDDLPFNCNSLPDVYTQFRKLVESKSKMRSCIKIPTSLGPAPSIRDWGCIPEITVLGLEKAKVSKGMAFVGGESAAVSRVCEYFWNKVKRFERERVSNDSTYWVLFEMMWRDYFRFLSIKQGNSIFHAGGPRKVEANWSQNQTLFEAWRNGQTGYPLIDANMKELLTTGFMSNRGRQIVCSFLVRDMNIDWRMGAEWFETCLLDYDPCSNYGNWTYGAGVGNDPREDRYFSIPKQAQNYDPEGEFVAYWLPQLRALPKEKRHFPGLLYIKPVVALKFGNTKTTNNKTMASGTADENKCKGRKGNRTQ